MATVTPAAEAWANPSDAVVRLRLPPAVARSDDHLLELSSLNRDLRLEINAEGELLIMPPAGGDTGDSEAEIGMQLRRWAKHEATGTTFSSSAGFRLPNGALRSPDSSWIPHERLAQFTPEQRKKFIPACPDFVLELRSPSDAMADLHAKLREYIANGARLGWLLDPETRRVFVYRPDAPVEQLDDPATVSGDPVLPGFVLDLREVW